MFRLYRSELRLPESNLLELLKQASSKLSEIESRAKAA